jgi:hypothetical protein
VPGAAGGRRPGAHRDAGIVAAWVFNVVGLADALRNCVMGMKTGAPAHMGAGVLIPAFGVPLLIVSHALIFKLLIDHARTTRELDA